MTSAPLPQPRFRATLPVLTVLAALLLGAAMPAMADAVDDAQKLVRRNQYLQAQEKIDVALAEDPNNAQALFLKGVVLSETGQTEDAIAVFTRLTETYPEMPEPYNNLAVIYARQKSYEQARQALEMAIRANPTYGTAYENLGDIYAKLANQSYARAAQLEPNSKSARAKLTLSNELLGSSAKQASR